jgi:hypothetical protein
VAVGDRDDAERHQRQRAASRRRLTSRRNQSSSRHAAVRATPYLIT